jgi:hypothetical protein
MKRFITLIPIFATLALVAPATSQAHSTRPVCHLVSQVKEFGKTGNYYIEESCAKRVCHLVLTPREFREQGGFELTHEWYLEEHVVCGRR